MEAQTDLSMITLFLRADWIVKAVMIALLAASVWSWAIILDKIRRLAILNRHAKNFEEKFWSGEPLDDLYDSLGKSAKDPMSAIFVAAMREWQRSIERTRTEAASLRTSLAQRIERVMQITSERELERVEARMGFLASTGSVAPFIGLFGTVWGIMNSFHAIGVSKNTSLAVVAPGIAEALFATALGLVAAIPAVIAYNKISTDIDRYAKRLDIFSSEFSAIISRQLDERR